MSQLTTDAALQVVKNAIATIAPDIEDELNALDVEVDVWDELELDSMDHLNAMAELKDQTGVDVPERQYPRVRSLGALAEYVAAHAT